MKKKTFIVHSLSMFQHSEREFLELLMKQNYEDRETVPIIIRLQIRSMFSTKIPRSSLAGISFKCISYLDDVFRLDVSLSLFPGAFQQPLKKISKSLLDNE